MIRNIQKLSGTALVADAFILFGLIYIFSTEIGVLADNGLADIQLFNQKNFPLLIGFAPFLHLFAFETDVFATELLYSHSRESD